jgi:pyruvate/2-oxoglutarate dehydrogenase complex dihydrolipoamide acyltransferase (E2) component
VELPEISWRPLGQLFVEKGLLEEDRLEHALAEQAESGGRLGEKLVELGYVSSTALARLLAEQYGVELTLDTGFGTGLRAVLESRQDDANGQAADEPAVLTLVEAPPNPNIKDDTAHTPLGALEDQLAKLAAAEAQVSELEAIVDQMRQTLGERELQVADLVDQLRQRDDELAKLATAAPAKKRRAASS